jgi:hypothetical protein
LCCIQSQKEENSIVAKVLFCYKLVIYLCNRLSAYLNKQPEMFFRKSFFLVKNVLRVSALYFHKPSSGTGNKYIWKENNNRYKVLQH